MTVIPETQLYTIKVGTSRYLVFTLTAFQQHECMVAVCSIGKSNVS